ncbi:DUF4292 domain-containing protein [Pontibacter sp. SGAir0037]|uniref:DUF4292 domain-containing protein n=1 Tax=Pontibacter sp. SGAir0037 TaxID=2571030 RepID=UPI0010CD553E|nr:DUF4292 domain-containing protein [Pontibacter sp. SGAir0037]QCR24413.1 DUF4292 domain-containing protein [Pontibacter sp. SGAir0037]
MNKQFFIYLLAIVMFSACKKEIAPTTASTTTETVGNVSIKNLEFNYLSARGNLKFEDKGQTTSSGYALRMKKDSVIWISVLPGLGIEAARIKITQDSVYVMNRLQKEYIATDYRFLSNQFRVNLNFDAVQAILIGNYQPVGREKAIDEGQMHHVQQLRNYLLFDYFINKESEKLQQLHVNDQQSGNNIVVKYENFQNIGAVPFAHALAAQILQAGQTSVFNLTHNRVTITDDPQDFPFTVPGDYKKL